MFHLKLVINFSLINCRVKLTGTPSVTTIRSGALPMSGESSGSAPRGFSRLATCAGGYLSLSVIDTSLARLVGPQSFDQKSTTIVIMDNQTILKVNLEDLSDDQKALIEQAAEELK